MRRVVGALLLCLALAGCGGDEVANDVKERVDPIAEAAQKSVEAGGARIDGRMWVSIKGVRARMDVSGAVSFADDRLALHVDYAANGVPGATTRAMRALRRLTGFPRDQILDAGVAFILNPRVRALDGGDRWLFVDLDKVHEAGEVDLRRLAGMPEVNPAAMLEIVRTTGESRADGQEAVGGESLRRYRVRVDHAAFASAVPEEDRAAAERTMALVERWWGEEARDVTLWIDPAGLVRRLRFSFALPMIHQVYPATAEFDFVDLGNAPAIDIPDVEDTTNATPLAIEHAR